MLRERDYSGRGNARLILFVCFSTLGGSYAPICMCSFFPVLASIQQLLWNMHQLFPLTEAYVRCTVQKLARVCLGESFKPKYNDDELDHMMFLYSGKLSKNEVEDILAGVRYEVPVIETLPGLTIDQIWAMWIHFWNHDGLKLDSCEEARQEFQNVKRKWKTYCMAESQHQV